MIPVKRLPLQPASTAVLARRQRSANKLAPRDIHINYLWQYFLRQDKVIARPNVAALRDVRAQLEAMFAGKCCYCESIIAKDVEHFYPKALYPGKMFAWENLLQSCKNCNFLKLTQDPDETGRRTLLDPTLDRPEDHLEWDLQTGMPIFLNVQSGTHRGERTVRVCGLDNQKFNEQRRKQASRFLTILGYAAAETPVAADTRKMLDDLLDPGEPWLGVIRQIVRDPQQRALLDTVEHKLSHIKPRLDALRWTHP